MMNKPTKVAVFILLAFFVSNTAFAAEMYFKAYNVSDGFLVDILLDTDGNTVNAIDGKVVFQHDLIEIEEIRDGDSSINLWIEKPSSGKEGEIIFSGITPGGFYGGEKTIFSMLIKQKGDVVGSIGIEDLRILKNDGNGAEVVSRVSNLDLPIKTELNISERKIGEVDTDPPEDFKPLVVSDKNIFDGKFTLIFATQDKGSGIKHYEVKENKSEDFEIVESPYLLKDQILDNKILIKVVDNSLNERIVEYIPYDYKHWYERYGIIAIIILIAFMFVKRKTWLKFIK